MIFRNQCRLSLISFLLILGAALNAGPVTADELNPDLTQNVPLSEVFEINEEMGRALSPPSSCRAAVSQWRSVTGSLCKPKRTYLQKWLDQNRSSRSDQPVPSGLENCVSNALQNPHHSAEPQMYGQCEGSGGKLVRGVGYACATPELTHFMTRTLIQATQCLGLDPRELLPTFARESRFHPNVVSPAGAWGPGQLMDSAVTTINAQLAARDLNPASFPLKVSTDPECAAVKDIINHPASRLNHGSTTGSSSVCERIKGPEGPLKNLVYASLLYLTNKNSAVEVIRSWKKIPRLATIAVAPAVSDSTAITPTQSALSVPSPSPVESAMSQMPASDPALTEVDRMAADVALYMYNGGGVSRLNLLKRFVADPRNDPQMGLEQFRAKFQEAIGSASGKRENYRYLEATRITAAQLGPGCSQPGFALDLDAYQKAHPKRRTPQL